MDRKNMICFGMAAAMLLFTAGCAQEKQQPKVSDKHSVTMNADQFAEEKLIQGDYAKILVEKAELSPVYARKVASDRFEELQETGGEMYLYTGDYYPNDICERYGWGVRYQFTVIAADGEFADTDLVWAEPFESCPAKYESKTSLFEQNSESTIQLLDRGRLSDGEQSIDFNISVTLKPPK